MWKANAPNFGLDFTINALVDRMSDKGLRNELLANAEAFRDNRRKLQKLIYDDKVSSAFREHGVFRELNISKEDLVKLYENRLGRSGNGEPHKIRAAVLFGPQGHANEHGKNTQLCAYCNLESANTLDHFLPKATFPELAIEVWNLIPACSTCNSSYLRKGGTDAPVIEDFFHPFNIPELGRWLCAKAEVKGGSVVVRFICAPVETVDPRLAVRAKKEFEALGLSKRLSLAASGFIYDEETGIRAAGMVSIDDVSSLLRAKAELLLERETNSPRGVTLEALSNSSEACRLLTGMGMPEPTKKGGRVLQIRDFYDEESGEFRDELNSQIAYHD